MTSEIKIECPCCKNMFPDSELIRLNSYQLNNTEYLFDVKVDPTRGYCSQCVWSVVEVVNTHAFHMNYDDKCTAKDLNTLFAMDRILSTEVHRYLKDVEREKQDQIDQIIESTPNVTSLTEYKKDRTKGKVKAKTDLRKALTPQSLVAGLNDKVVGQYEAKKSLAYSAWKHWLSGKSEKIDRSNVLIAGNTGTGKTLMGEHLASLVNAKFFTFDCSQLTASGYIGVGISGLAQLIYEARQEHLKDVNNSGKPFSAIVLLDEIDKLVPTPTGHGSRIGFGERLQVEMLRLLQGGIYQLQYKTEKGGEATVEVDMSEVLFIGCGAFEGLQEKVEKSKNKSGGIGLTKSNKIKTDEEFKFDADTLGQWGFNSQFAARFKIITQTNDLTEEELLDILKLHCIPEYDEMARCLGVDLEFEDKMLRSIVHQCISEKIGARGLHKSFETRMQDIWWEITSSGDSFSDVKYVVTTEGLKIIDKNNDQKAS